MKIEAIIHPVKEDVYWAEVPALPSCITEESSIDKVINNLQATRQGWLKVANESQANFCGDSVNAIATIIDNRS